MNGATSGPLAAPSLARSIVAVVTGGFCLVTLMTVIDRGTGPGSAATSVGYPLAISMVATVVAALEVYGLTRLAGLITELLAARTEPAQAAVAHERLRFARDLHDLLGLSLSAIVPKGELVRCLIPGNPARARRELTGILGVARRALADVRAVADGYRDLDLEDGPRPAEPADPGERTPRRAVLLIKVLGVALLCGSFVQGVLHLARLAEDFPPFAAGAGALLLLLVSQLRHFTRSGARLRSAVGIGLLAAQAVLVFAPAIGFGMPPVGAGFLAGSLLLMLPQAAGVAAVALIVVSAGWVQVAATGLDLDVVRTMADVVISGLVVFGLTWMVRSVRGLRAARIQLAQIAVAKERLRFARDLHDLLGLSLSAITLKSELAGQLVARCPVRACEELTEILDIARLALADVRLVASGYRELSLRQEFRTAESLLTAAEVHVRLDVCCGELPGHIGTLLATVLREGVTNVLRHSKGERCEITVRRRDDMVWLEIVNDGVVKHPVRRPAGRGIDNLSYRAGQLGGKVTAGLEPDGRFRLRAMVPA